MRAGLWALLGICATTSMAMALDHGAERKTVTMVVIHSVGGPTCPASKVVYPPVGNNTQARLASIEHDPTIGIHYMIGRDGSVYGSIPEMQVANHVLGNNPRSIGIELLNRGDGEEPYPAIQVARAACLVGSILARQHVSPSNVVRHSDLDKGLALCGDHKTKYRRKTDPGAAFPWQQFKAQMLKCTKFPAPCGMTNMAVGRYHGTWRAIEDHVVSSGTADSWAIAANRAGSVAATAEIIEDGERSNHSLVLPKSGGSFTKTLTFSPDDDTTTTAMANGTVGSGAVNGFYNYRSTWPQGVETGSGSYPLRCN